MKASAIGMLRRYGYLAASTVLAFSNISVSTYARAEIILVTNSGLGTISKFAPDGTDLGLFASTGLGGPSCFVIVPEPSMLTMIDIAALVLVGWVQRSKPFAR